jgi:hypothetical protein
MTFDIKSSRNKERKRCSLPIGSLKQLNVLSTSKITGSLLSEYCSDWSRPLLLTGKIQQHLKYRTLTTIHIHYEESNIFLMERVTSILFRFYILLQRTCASFYAINCLASKWLARTYLCFESNFPEVPLSNEKHESK